MNLKGNKVNRNQVATQIRKDKRKVIPIEPIEIIPIAISPKPVLVIEKVKKSKKGK